MNPSFDPQYRPETPSRRASDFHRRLPQYRRTPLHRLQSLARTLGVREILLKDESKRLGLPAFKILGASWATYRALCDRYPMMNEDWKTIDELAVRVRALDVPMLYSATDGNHGRAVARMALWLGLQSRIYVPEGTAAARIEAIESEGARVEIVDGSYNTAVAQAAHDAHASGGLLIQDNGWEGYETIPLYVVEGYATMMWEIEETLAETGLPRPTHVLVQIGVGSFADAVVRHFAWTVPSPVIIGVEPESAACALESVRAKRIVRVPGPHTSIMAGMNCDSPSTVSFPILQKGMFGFVSIGDRWTIEAMNVLAASGIVSGETGAAGLGALLALASDPVSRTRFTLGEESTVLVFSTEGATNPDLYATLVDQQKSIIKNN